MIVAASFTALVAYDEQRALDDVSRRRATIA